MVVAMMGDTTARMETLTMLMMAGGSAGGDWDPAEFVETHSKRSAEAYWGLGMT